MGRPVVHFEVMGKNAEELRSFYAELFDWKIDEDNALDYGLVERETNFEGSVFPGASVAFPTACPDT
jgi:predicted enzyme related to lactoylglutathione lyase